MVTVESSANLAMKSAGAHFNDECSDGNEYEKSFGGLLAMHSQARTVRPSLIWLYPLDLLKTFLIAFGVIVSEPRFKPVKVEVCC